MRETDPDMQKTSPWLIAARVIFTFALIACIVFIFSNSMQIGDVSETASGRVLLLMKKVFTRLGMPGAANHLTDHIVRKLAHFCEYALEGFLLTLCLRVYARRFFVHISWPIMFSDGRSSQRTDVWLEFSGAMAGILVGLFCLALCRMCWLLYKHRNED